MRDAQRYLPVPAGGLELDVARSGRRRQVGRLRERRSRGAGEPLGAQGQRVACRHGQDDGDTVARLRIGHGNDPGTRLLQQTPRRHR